MALVLLAVTAPASASAAYRATTPSPHTLYQDGQDGRYLVDGPWLFRLDPGGALARKLPRQASIAGWRGITVPYTWNAHDNSEQSYSGGVGWYRKDFRLPDRSGGTSWVMRFESVNYRSTVWLNGHRLGNHTGEFLPFELPLPGLRRNGVNRLVVRVDSTHGRADFPPIRVSVAGDPTGGWWNESGFNREVYLRRVRTVDLERVGVTPDLPCPRCAANIRYTAQLRSYASKSTRVTVTASFGSLHKTLGTVVVPAHGATSVGGSLRLARPRLWAPGHPYLYPARVSATVGKHVLASYALHSGVRSIKVNGSGQLLLNGRQLHFRGVGLQEDSPATGWALTPAFERELMGNVQSVGATLIRAHYPLNPYLEELADRRGVLLWSEIPVYQLQPDDIGRPSTRRAAVATLRTNILTNRNHASVLLWSIANELSSHVDALQAAYIHDAAKMAHELDPTRPVGLAVVGYLGLPCQRGYAPLDLIGFNDYFGWYTGPLGVIADRDELSSYIDTLRRCYPHQAVVMSEFGAEANRAGPVEEKGTYANQQAFVRYHLGVFATKPWLAGAVYWAIREFRVRPGWNGGNPRPDPPMHQKGLLSFGGTPKPAFFDVRKAYRSFKQYGGGR